MVCFNEVKLFTQQFWSNVEFEHDIVMKEASVTEQGEEKAVTLGKHGSHMFRIIEKVANFSTIIAKKVLDGIIISPQGQNGQVSREKRISQKLKDQMNEKD